MVILRIPIINALAVYVIIESQSTLLCKISVDLTGRFTYLLGGFVPNPIECAVTPLTSRTWRMNQFNRWCLDHAVGSIGLYAPSSSHDVTWYISECIQVKLRKFKKFRLCWTCTAAVEIAKPLTVICAVSIKFLKSFFFIMGPRNFNCFFLLLFLFF